jgi:hypothetical protein
MLIVAMGFWVCAMVMAFFGGMLWMQCSHFEAEARKRLEEKKRADIEKALKGLRKGNHED